MAYFADTSFFLALLSETDAVHAAATRFAAKPNLDMVTTTWVLVETGDAPSAPNRRRLFTAFWEELRRRSDVTTLPPTQEQVIGGMELFRRRADKAWTLTHCISFVAMSQHKITDALTADKSLELAGFRALLIGA